LKTRPARETKTKASANLEELAKRIQLLEDREGVRECLSRYCFNADLGRAEEYANTFTPDGVLDMAGASLIGHDGLLDMFAGANVHTSIMNLCTHNITNAFIRVDGDTAWAEGYQIVLVKDRNGEERRVRWMGMNHWTFEKRSGRWYIKKRVRREAGGDEWGGKIIRQYLETTQAGT